MNITHNYSPAKFFPMIFSVALIVTIYGVGNLNSELNNIHGLSNPASVSLDGYSHSNDRGYAARMTQRNR